MDSERTCGDHRHTPSNRPADLIEYNSRKRLFQTRYRRAEGGSARGFAVIDRWVDTMQPEYRSARAPRTAPTINRHSQPLPDMREDKPLQRFKIHGAQRLRLKRDFDQVFAGKRRASDHQLIVFIRANELAHSRLGVRVGKHVGGSVTRNRVKRLIREAFRLSQHEFPEYLDIVCVAKRSSNDSLQSYQHSLTALVRTAQRKRSRKTP